MSPKTGQAAIEYVLLVGISVLIFGAVFFAIRQSVFRLWICEITPRIHDASGCNFNGSPQPRDCGTGVINSAAWAEYCPQ